MQQTVIRTANPLNARRMAVPRAALPMPSVVCTACNLRTFTWRGKCIHCKASLVSMTQGVVQR